MDGNRRWAEEKGFPKSYGHLQGVQAVKRTVQYCVDHKIPYLTLFAFSTENWKRPSKEVQEIFKIFEKSLVRYESFIRSLKIKLHLIGDLSLLPSSAGKAFQTVSHAAQANDQLNLILAVNYGGRKEILEACQKMYKEEKDCSQATEDTLRSYLQSSTFPDPDLLIRTGGVRRLSNFYLWTSAYSELYFSDLNWPDFDSKEMEKAVSYYMKTQRRFGGA